MSTRSVCAACGLSAHRYGTNDPAHDFDPIACINGLKGEIERLRGELQATQMLLAALNGEDGLGYL